MKDQLPRLVQILETLHAVMLDDQNRRQRVLVVSWQSSARYCESD